VNTVVLITSSLMVVLGVDAIRRGKARLFEACFGATILLAGVFLCVKYADTPRSSTTAVPAHNLSSRSIS